MFWNAFFICSFYFSFTFIRRFRLPSVLILAFSSSSTSVVGQINWLYGAFAEFWHKWDEKTPHYLWVTRFHGANKQFDNFLSRIYGSYYSRIWQSQGFFHSISFSLLYFFLRQFDSFIWWCLTNKNQNYNATSHICSLSSSQAFFRSFDLFFFCFPIALAIALEIRKYYTDVNFVPKSNQYLNMIHKLEFKDLSIKKYHFYVCMLCV